MFSEEDILWTQNLLILWGWNIYWPPPHPVSSCQILQPKISQHFFYELRFVKKNVINYWFIVFNFNNEKSTHIFVMRHFKLLEPKHQMELMNSQQNLEIDLISTVSFFTSIFEYYYRNNVKIGITGTSDRV